MVGSKNYVVSNLLSQATFGYEFEAVGTLTNEGDQVLLNGIAVNNLIDQLTQGYQGAAAIQIFITPIMSTVVTTAPRAAK